MPFAVCTDCRRLQARQSERSDPWSEGEGGAAAGGTRCQAPPLLCLCACASFNLSSRTAALLARLSCCRSTRASSISLKVSPPSPAQRHSGGRCVDDGIEGGWDDHRTLFSCCRPPLRHALRARDSECNRGHGAGLPFECHCRLMGWPFPLDSVDRHGSLPWWGSTHSHA